MVIDTDGSAFITKAEFDSLKNNFQAQIDNYNNSIDSKIDGAIAAYLSGITVSQELRLFVDPTNNLKFRNKLMFTETQADEGLLQLSHTRINRINGLNSVTAVPGSWTTITEQKLFKFTIDNPDDTAWVKYCNVIDTMSVVDGPFVVGTPNNGFTVSFPAGIHVTGLDFTSNTTIKDSAIALLKANWTSTTLSASKQTIANAIGAFLVGNCIMKGEAGSLKFSTGAWGSLSGFAVLAPTINPNTSETYSVNVKNFIDDDTFGIGYSADLTNGQIYLKKYYKKISILNTFDFQEYTFKDISDPSYFNSPNAWDETNTNAINKSFTPHLNWDREIQGTMVDFDTTSHTASSYCQYQPSMIRIEDSSIWSEYDQLGTNIFTDQIRIFNDSCNLVSGGSTTIDGDQFKYYRNGYYIDASTDTFVTNSNNYVDCGDVTYNKLIWDSNIYNTDSIVQQLFSSKTNQIVFLGGGIPLVQTAVDYNGIKIKLDYEVTKEDGTPLTATDGNMNIKIELSNKQFKNGNLDTGAQSKGTYNATVMHTSSTGSWISNPFGLEAKGMVWLNAYVTDKQGYNVIIKNINVQ